MTLTEVSKNVSHCGRSQSLSLTVADKDHKLRVKDRDPFGRELNGIIVDGR